jgi:transcriptional regulator with XRE-family HTH domain
MPDLCLNVRFLLWKKGVARAEWPSKLAALLGWSEVAVESFLSGESGALSDTELKTLARFGGVSESDLTTKDLLAAANIDLFHENISFLIDLLPHGEKKRFAENLGVDATTISRWKNGSQRPTKRKIAAILDYFSVPDEVAIGTTPIFLSSDPVGIEETRSWLHHRADLIEGRVLHQIFPALKRLLSR